MRGATAHSPRMPHSQQGRRQTKVNVPAFEAKRSSSPNGDSSLTSEENSDERNAATTGRARESIKQVNPAICRDKAAAHPHHDVAIHVSSVTAKPYKVPIKRTMCRSPSGCELDSLEPHDGSHPSAHSGHRGGFPDENIANDKAGANSLYKRRELTSPAGKTEEVSRDSEFASLDVEHETSEPEKVRIVHYTRPLKTGETSRMLEKLAKHASLAQSVLSPHYTDTPSRRLPYQEYVNEPMFHCITAYRRYTQVLLWCLSRRMTMLANSATTSCSMRLIHVLGSIRAKIRNSDLEAFTLRGSGSSPLKPMQKNPKNVRGTQDLELFTAFSQELELSKLEGIKMLDLAEKRIAAAANEISATSRLSAPALEWSKLNHMRSKAHVHMREIITQSLTYEALVEDGRRLLDELRDQHIDARCEDLSEVLKF